METYKIYYTIHNAGDGSAHPSFHESEKLAEWVEDHMEEGWGDSSVGVITIKGENVTVADVFTKETYLVTLVDNIYDKRDKQLVKDFVKDFFKGQFPELTLVDNPDSYIAVLHNDKFKGKILFPNKAAMKSLQKTLTKFHEKEQ